MQQRPLNALLFLTVQFNLRPIYLRGKVSTIPSVSPEHCFFRWPIFWSFVGRPGRNYSHLFPLWGRSPGGCLACLITIVQTWAERTFLRGSKCPCKRGSLWLVNGHWFRSSSLHLETIVETKRLSNFILLRESLRLATILLSVFFSI